MNTTNKLINYSGGGTELPSYKTFIVLDNNTQPIEKPRDQIDPLRNHVMLCPKCGHGILYNDER